MIDTIIHFLLSRARSIVPKFRYKVRFTKQLFRSESHYYHLLYVKSWTGPEDAKKLEIIYFGNSILI